MHIGILGAGLIGCEHLTGLADLIEREILDAELTGLFDPDPGRARGAADRFGLPRRFDSAAELVESPDIDVVFVTSWTSAHHDPVAQCASRRKPVFCEKPLARNLAEARTMARLVDEAGVANQIGLILRTSPAFGFARRLCRQRADELGRLMAVHFRDDQYFPIQGRYASSWRRDPAIAGGGTFIEHSIHDVDLMRWMFGDFQSVQAQLGNFAGHAGIEDLAVVTAQLAAGGWIQLLSVWHQILSRPSTRYLEMFFERARISVEEEVFGPVVLELGDAEPQRFEQPDIAQAYLQDNPDLLALGLRVASPQAIEDYRFLRALAEGRRPEPDFSVGVAAHEVVEAAYRSAREQRPVHLPLDRMAEADPP